MWVKRVHENWVWRPANSFRVVRRNILAAHPCPDPTSCRPCHHAPGTAMWPELVVVCKWGKTAPLVAMTPQRAGRIDNRKGVFLLLQLQHVSYWPNCQCHTGQDPLELVSFKIQTVCALQHPEREFFGGWCIHNKYAFLLWWSEFHLIPPHTSSAAEKMLLVPTFNLPSNSYCKAHLLSFRFLPNQHQHTHTPYSSPFFHLYVYPALLPVWVPVQPLLTS